jgi:hypothetical protein
MPINSYLIQEEGISNFTRKFTFYEELIGKEKLIGLANKKPDIFLNLLDSSYLIEKRNIVKNKKNPNSTRLLTEKGFFKLLALIYKFKTQFPEQDFKKILTSDTNFFFNLLSDNDTYFCYTNTLPKTKENVIEDWAEDNYTIYFKKLALTQMQILLLKGILSGDTITLFDLEKFLQKNRIKVKTGSMVGGSLAGISKKCTAYKIPQLFIIKKLIKDKIPQNRYLITASAKKFLIKYLKDL